MQKHVIIYEEQLTTNHHCQEIDSNLLRNSLLSLPTLHNFNIPGFASRVFWDLSMTAFFPIVVQWSLDFLQSLHQDYSFHFELFPFCFVYETIFSVLHRMSEHAHTHTHTPPPALWTSLSPVGFYLCPSPLARAFAASGAYLRHHDVSVRTLLTSW